MMQKSSTKSSLHRRRDLGAAVVRLHLADQVPRKAEPWDAGQRVVVKRRPGLE